MSHDGESKKQNADLIGLGCTGTASCGCLVICLAIFLAVVAAQYYNTIVKPIPSPPNKVVDELPDMLAKLRGSKTRAESRGAAAKLALGKTPDVGKEANGRVLYGEAQATADECIEFAEAALQRRFQSQDEKELVNRLQRAMGTRDEFARWCDGVLGPLIEAEPFQPPADFVSAWLDRLSREDSEAREKLRLQLEACRWRNWDELGGSTPPRPN